MRIPMIFLSILTAGVLAAGTGSTPTATDHTKNFRQTRMERLTKDLNLTPDQQYKVKAIFRDSRAEMKSLAPKLREEHEALASAVKSDSAPRIDQIVQQNSQLNAQAEAIHVKTWAKIYSVLNTNQKTKWDHRVNRMLGSHPGGQERSTS